MTKTRLQNIALYYLERFDSSALNLRKVLEQRLAKYSFEVPDFNINEAKTWIDEIISYCERYGYINDDRYAEIKINNYLLAGKPTRYIQQKMQQKGISEDVVGKILQNRNIDESEMALNFAAKKKIGPFRPDEESRKQNRQKDLATIVRAGFPYDVAKDIVFAENIGDFS
ncbi:MAG: regulatory protein RecX [Alphaproteobacteria bacterium]|nr:regulatory protein RecX [Alphaproteobacteria bacterium]